MPRNLYPVRFRVEFSGDTPSHEWEGYVDAKSRDMGIAFAAVKARDEGALFTQESRVIIERVG